MRSVSCRDLHITYKCSDIVQFECSNIARTNVHVSMECHLNEVCSTSSCYVAHMSCTIY